MVRNYYTEAEIILCAYAALYDAGDFGGVECIGLLTKRSDASIQMKIRNICAILDSKGIQRFNLLSGLTGRSSGETVRKTHWDFIETVVKLSKHDLLQRCLEVIETRKE